MDISTLRRHFAVFAASLISFTGKGQRVLGRNRPALMPCSLAEFTADFTTLAVAPNAQRRISQSSVR